MTNIKNKDIKKLLWFPNPLRCYKQICTPYNSRINFPCAT